MYKRAVKSPKKEHNPCELLDFVGLAIDFTISQLFYVTFFHLLEKLTQKYRK